MIAEKQSLRAALAAAICAFGVSFGAVFCPVSRVHGIPHTGGGIAVGVHPLAAGYGIQLGAFLGLLPLQSGRLSLPVRLRGSFTGKPC